MATDNDTTEACKPESGLEEINRHHNIIACEICNIEGLAGLLETLSEKGYASASAAQALEAKGHSVSFADTDWQMRWWSQATCIATMLEKLAKELETENEAIHSVVYAIQKGRRTP
jgi:hypothetical protein